MAATRTRTDGTSAFIVTWRAGGVRGGKQEQETIGTTRLASKFRRNVEAAGEQWPEGWIRGVGYRSEVAAPTGDHDLLPL